MTLHIFITAFATMDGLFGGDEVRSERDDRQWQRKTAVWREWQPCYTLSESFHLKVSSFRRARVIAYTFSRLFVLVRARVISFENVTMNYGMCICVCARNSQIGLNTMTNMTKTTATTTRMERAMERLWEARCTF
jgi:hypothetical protein